MINTINKKLTPTTIKNISNEKFIVKKVEEKTAKNGNPYVKLTLEDKQGKETIAILFDTEKPLFREGSTVVVSGKLSIFAHKNKLDIKEIQYEPNEEEVEDITDTIYGTDADTTKEKKEINNLVMSIKNKKLWEFVVTTIKEYETQYFTVPGGKVYHDVKTKGLVQHSINVAKNALKLSEQYDFSQKDKDLIISGALLHDIGKVDKNYTPKTVNLLSLQILTKINNKVKIDPEIFNALMRIVISHQGSKEKGAFIEPETPVEKIIAVANEIDVFIKRSQKL